MTHIENWQQRAEAAETRVAELEAACRALIAWFESESAGPDYGSLTRDTHPDGEQIWRTWYNGQLAQCDRAEKLARQALISAETSVKAGASEGTAVREAERAVVEAAVYAREMDWLHDTAALEKACNSLTKIRQAMEEQDG